LARALIVGCGCHGRELGSELSARGWQVRGTSRSSAGLDAIRTAGLEPAAADPDRPGTVLELCGDVAVVIWLLGSVTGERAALASVQGPRLESLLEKLVDTPVRGFAYEVAGSVDPAVMAAGGEIVERAGRIWRIPVTLLAEDRAGPGWTERTADAVAALLGV
jgi:uncharacterized protein YbjT (DUF2867 family)